MTKTQAKQLRDFLSRMGMYVQPISKTSITSFIHGFELGTNRDFTKQLTQYLENEKGIKCRSLGWPNQIERLAVQNQSDWVAVFMEMSYILLNRLFPSRGYLLIEPTFVSEMMGNFHYDIITRCLEYVRINIDKIFPQLIDFCEFDLIAVITPHNKGAAYPMLGIFCKDESRGKEIPNFSDVGKIVDEFVHQLSFEILLEMSNDFDYIDWEKLEKSGTFPER